MNVENRRIIEYNPICGDMINSLIISIIGSGVSMEKRFQVFVSSTYEDLQEERKEVMQALLELDCIPAGMELFPASSEDQWTGN